MDKGYFDEIKELLEPTTILHGRYKFQKAESSKSIISDGDIALSLFEAFNLNDGSDIETFRKNYEMGTSGDGDEESKILTIHSSSLLALLCFFSISPTNPLTIGEDKYTEVMFEVKNTVITDKSGKPSNIDVLLISKSNDGSVRKLLFLESKFTEYATHGREALAPKYLDFYNLLNKQISDFKFHISDYDIRHRDGSVSSAFGLWSEDSQYLGGIKQAFSHLLGISTGPAKDDNPYRKSYESYYHQAQEVEFATIVHDWDTVEFTRYSDLYADTFKPENWKIIREILKNVAPNKSIVERLHIHHEILTYRNLFKDFNLPGNIKRVYKL